MQANSTKGARPILRRAMQPFANPSGWLRIGDDPYLFYTATLVPIVILVALVGRRPGEVVIAVVLGALAIGVQALLGYLGKRRKLRGRIGWQLVRLLAPLLFVAITSRAIGGPSLPLIALYIPVVAA
ncbi:MAG: hypothetical protein ABIZ57_03535, partial [Candidatus Limnocylindria bacterium]